MPLSCWSLSLARRCFLWSWYMHNNWEKNWFDMHASVKLIISILFFQLFLSHVVHTYAVMQDRHHNFWRNWTSRNTFVQVLDHGNTLSSPTTLWLLGKTWCLPTSFFSQVISLVPQLGLSKIGIVTLKKASNNVVYKKAQPTQA